MKKLVLTMLSASAFATAAFAGSYSDESNTAEYAPEYVNEQAAADTAASDDVADDAPVVDDDPTAGMA